MFVQPIIQSAAKAETENVKKGLSPTHDKEVRPENGSQDILPQTQHSPPIKEDATESEVESIQYDKNPKLQKKGNNWTELISRNLLSLAQTYSCLVSFL